MYSIVNFNEHGHYFLPHCAENYLNVIGPTYRVESIDGKKLKLQKENPSRSLVSTVLKVVSYFTIVLPLLALAIRQYNRSRFSIAFYNDLDQGAFINAIEEKLRMNKDPVLKIHTLMVEMSRSKEKASLQNIPSHLATANSYLENLPDLLKNTCLTLLAISRHPTQENITKAKDLYRQVAAFYRNHVRNDTTLQEGYKANLQNVFDDDGKTLAPGYIIQGICKDATVKHTETLNSEHALMYFLLKHLRKQIKLKTKLQKVEAKIRATPEFQNTNQPLLHQAIQCLSLKWFHGTQGIIVNKVMENTDGYLLPSGKLKRGHLITGEVKEGLFGINSSSLSGTGLGQVDYALRYVKKGFDINEEKQFYQKFMSLSINGYRDAIDTDGAFSRMSVALQRVAKYDPHSFQASKDQIIAQVEKLERQIDEHVFTPKPEQIFDESKSSDSYSFYIVLKELTEIKALVNKSNITPLSAQEKAELANPVSLVLGSDNQYGIPLTLKTSDMDYEEVFPGGLKLGQDLTHAFVPEDKIPEFNQKLSAYGLEQKIQVFSLEVLKLAEKLEHSLGSYFYDVLNVKKLAVM